jgi:hypothetical protein
LGRKGSRFIKGSKVNNVLAILIRGKKRGSGNWIGVENFQKRMK